MSTSTHPRDRLINTAAELVHRQGWNATGINQILSDAGIPKGSFYYYFRSKEALGLAVIQSHCAVVKQLLDRTLSNPDIQPDAALYELMREIARLQAQNPYKMGCPIGTLASEVAPLSPALLAETNRGLSMYESAWQDLIARGQRDGSISPTLQSAEVARITSMIMQGALLSLRCTSSFETIELAFNWIHQTLFARAPSQPLRREDCQKALAS